MGMISSRIFPQNRYIKRCKKENNEQSLRGKHVLVIGATQGIGAAVARRFSALGCKISIAGRSEGRAKSVLWEANLAHPGPLGKYYIVDLSSMKEVERFTDEVIKDVAPKGGIDYLILSAGGPPLGKWRPGPDGLEQAFAVQCLSRFYTTYRLLPWIKESVVVIGSPGLGAFFDESDPGFEKPENKKQMTQLRQARRDCLYLDAIFKEFSVRNPKITFHHLFPGFVYTNNLDNQGFHPGMVTIGRFFGATIGQDPDTYADIPVRKAQTGGGGLQMTGMWGWKVGLEKWAQDEQKRKQLFEWSLQRAQTAAKQSQPKE